MNVLKLEFIEHSDHDWQAFIASQEQTNIFHHPAWDRFLANTCHGHHVQSSFWAQVKAFNHWKAVRVIASEGGNIVGGAQLLIRVLPFSSSVVYVSKGPILLEVHHLLAGDIISYIIWVSHQYHAHLLAIQPPNGGEEIAMRGSKQKYISQGDTT